jgi:hypothetical protein
MTSGIAETNTHIATAGTETARLGLLRVSFAFIRRLFLLCSPLNVNRRSLIDAYDFESRTSHSGSGDAELHPIRAVEFRHELSGKLVGGGRVWRGPFFRQF